MKPNCNKVFLIFLFLSTQFSLAKTSALKRTMFGFTFSSEYSYRFLKAESSYDWEVDLRNEMEVPKFGYTVGFNISQQIKKKFFVEVAFCYSNKGEQTKKSDLIYDDPEPYGAVSKYTRYTFGYCEIPVRLNYQLFDSASFFTSVGFAFEIPVLEKRKYFYTYSDGHESHVSSYTLSSSAEGGISIIAGIGYFFKVSKMLYIKSEPFFKCSMTPFYNSNIKDYFYSYGLDVGIYFSKRK